MKKIMAIIIGALVTVMLVGTIAFAGVTTSSTSTKSPITTTTVGGGVVPMGDPIGTVGY